MKLFFFISITCLLLKVSPLLAQKNILFINSYSSDFPTYADVKKAIDLYNDGENCHIDIEFLNTKELFDQTIKELQYKQLKYRISFRKPYDAIVTIDNNALDFAFTYRDSLFPGVPIVFCGVEDVRLINMAYASPGVSGITEFCAFSENISLALKLNPKLDELVAITDMTVTGQANMAIFNETIKEFNNTSFRTINFFHHGLNGFLDTISKIKGEKAILLISAYRDSTNFYYNFEPMVKDICKAANVPVYHLYYHGLGSGIVGGKLLTHYHMTHNALKMAIEETEKLWETKTIYNHETQNYYIDYSVAQKFWLNIENVPKGTIFTNEPVRTLNIQKDYFQLIITSIVLLLLLATVLVLNIRMKKKSNLELKKAKEKAEESDHFKTAFIANMSHELRTPMNSIIGFSSFFREEGINQQTRERYCNIIEQNANQLLALINDIIDIAKIESGELSFTPNKSNLFELVNTLVLESEKKIERKNKKIKIFLDFDLPTKQEINTDVIRFKQLTNNLLYNAIKYTEEGHIKVNCKTEGVMFLFSVSDTGIGISDLMKDKVFDRFTREDDAKKLYSGTGLGLAISKNIVEKWGGEIWFKSEKNKGSTFYFTHPI